MNVIERYHRILDGFNSGELAAALDVASRDLVYTYHGDNPVSGEYHGIDGFREVMRRVKELSAGTAHLEPIAIVGDDATVMVYGRFFATRNGRQFDTLAAYYYRFDEQGLLVEGHNHPGDQAGLNEFWST